MNIKLNTICFIILLFFIITAVSAGNADNETLQQTDQNHDTLQIDSETDHHDEKTLLKTDLKYDEKLEMTINNTALEASKSRSSLTPLPAVSLKAPAVKMYYNDGSKFTVTVKDKNSKAIAKAKVTIVIDSKVYSKTTDSKGKISMNLKLDVGKHPVKVYCPGAKNYREKLISSSITVKSTIKSKNLKKYYTNKAVFYSTFYDKKGKVLKNTQVKFKVNNKAYSAKTDKKGVGRLSGDFKPGNYQIKSVNPKTSEELTNYMNILSNIETHDVSARENDQSQFSVKVLDGNGKLSPNKQVIIKVNGKTYLAKTNSKGIASIVIDLARGKYSVTTEFSGLINTNTITVEKGIAHTPFSHIIQIPNYVNVTVPYAFQNSAYTLENGMNGTVKMPKYEVFTIQVKSGERYIFTTTEIADYPSHVIGYQTYFVPLDGGPLRSDYIKENLKGDGILLSAGENYTEIEFRSKTYENTEMFGMIMSEGVGNSEIFTYVQNNIIEARVAFSTYHYDETGVRYSIAKYFNRPVTEFDYRSYDSLTKHTADQIRFTQTGESVSFNSFGNCIIGNISEEPVTTRLIINGVEEMEKTEAISYGRNPKYNPYTAYEVLQSFAIINEDITQSIVDDWISRSSQYTMRLGVINIYSMFLTALTTAWIADGFADAYAKEYNVRWQRDKTTVILGGMNIEDTYLHILNTDMGMKVEGNNAEDILCFKLMNSFNLPEVEKIALMPIAETFNDTATGSLDDLFKNHSSYSIIQRGDLSLITVDGSDTVFVVNETSGVVDVLMNRNNFFYKGASVETTDDCCICNSIVYQTIKYIANVAFRTFVCNPITYSVVKDKGYIAGLLVYKALPYIRQTEIIPAVSGTVSGPVFAFAVKMQDMGVTYRQQSSQKDWQYLMDHFTFTRPGILQQKKVYSIPKKSGGYDYVEAPIKSDFSLDRDNTVYISEGNVKKLTREETYQYYSDDYYSLFNVPTKYWKT